MYDSRFLCINFCSVPDCTATFISGEGGCTVTETSEFIVRTATFISGEGSCTVTETSEFIVRIG